MRAKPKLCKTTVRILRPLRERLDELLTANGLKRDAYLNLVLEVEIPALDAEVERANSQSARRYIGDRLNGMRPRDLVTLTLRSDVTRRLDRVCRQKRICRDAFFNRLFFMLTAEPELVDLAFFGGDDSWRQDVWEECKHDGPFYANTFHPLRHEVDPFWAIRAGIQLRKEAGDKEIESTYQAYLWWPGRNNEPELLPGLHCFLPDGAVPRTEEFKRLGAVFGIPGNFGARR